MGTQIATAAWTAFFGVVIFVAGQTLQRFLLEPLQEFRKLAGDIADSLVFLGNALGAEEMVRHYLAGLHEVETGNDIGRRLLVERYEQLIRNQWSKSDEAKHTLRQQTSRLMGRSYAIPIYNQLAFCRLLPTRKNLLKASQYLVGLSNSDTLDSSIVKEIAKLLKINVVFERF